ncbi:YtxH domain-containing protein [Sporolactobacillus vineae]|uniref:YtxH domain-containing protein n=1 Tax=Sporolactobacillus vineae TaxID=444463 RepID=UPI000287EEEE|nr:YtxH domain-containing protein [Sporolactobacillus vineae]
MSAEKKEQACDCTNAKDIFLGGVIGGLIGAALALLFAPKTGEEVRNDLHLKKLVTDGVDKVKEAASTIANKDQEPYS